MEVLGLPDQPLPDDHLEGFVAETLWRCLSEDYQHRQPLEWINGNWNPTDPGGDGLIIHRSTRGELTFRLWEVKKTLATDGVLATVGRASRQLKERAPHYLARYMKVGEAQTTGEIRAFFGYLLDHWLDQAEAASAGVAIVTDSPTAPPDCFGQLPRQFPSLCNPSRLRGLLKSIPDFPQFCADVQEKVWIVL
jgi:hypothetical protein